MPEIKKTWSVPTSPRSPYKLADELKLLSQFEGREWSREIQRAFAEKLGQSDFFEGSIYQREPDFSARDRINRSPKTFGFVRFDNDNKIEITEAGKQLISGVRTNDLFLRQLLKWQYPSPKHNKKSYLSFKIKPFLEVLRLARELDGLTKKEIATFCVPFIDYGDYEKVKSEIENFRKTLDSLKGIEKKRFIIQAHINKFKEVYRSEIESGNFRLRQQGGVTTSAEAFIKTKVRNSIDYADAAIRYFRATGLFTLSSRTFRLTFIETKIDTVEKILKTTDREPSTFVDKESEFLNVLCDPNLPELPQDDKTILQKEMSLLLNKIKQQKVSPAVIGKFIDRISTFLTVAQLKETQDELEKVLRETVEREQIQELQSYQLFGEIKEIFEKIADRKDIDIPDKPLFFEWNTWRALNMLDDGEIKGNLSLDTEGKPLYTALGGLPDIVCYYKNFVLVVEVTLTSGATQFTAEGESVPRHLGDIVKNLRAKGDNRPVFGIFIAPNLNQATIAHFYSLRRTEIEFYGGKAKIIPLNVETFQKMLDIAKEAGGVKAEQLYSFIKWADEQANTGNESIWYSSISQKATEWLAIA